MLDSIVGVSRMSGPGSMPGRGLCSGLFRRSPLLRPSLQPPCCCPCPHMQPQRTARKDMRLRACNCMHTVFYACRPLRPVTPLHAPGTDKALRATGLT